MMDRISEMFELVLVKTGMALSQLSDEQKKTVSLFLVSLMFAAVVANVLEATLAR
jgi:nucleoside permease NupC